MATQNKKLYFAIFSLTAMLALMQLFQVSAQVQSKGDKATTKFLKNVVQLSVTFSDGSTGHGFGFVIGERGELLYVATAEHVVRKKKLPDVQKPDIEARFYSDRGNPVKVKLLDLPTVDVDLALLEIPKPFPEYRWENNYFASPRRNSAVWFIGRSQDWWVPSDKEAGVIKDVQILSIFPVRISSVLPGTSGAPLISGDGIIGMIIRDNGIGSADALGIETMRRIVKKIWHYPWGLIQRDKISLKHEPAKPADVKECFKLALGHYKEGNYNDAKKKLKDFDPKLLNRENQRDSVGRFFLLLGAVYENVKKKKRAKINYQEAKKCGVKTIEGVDLKSLKIYKKVFEKKVIEHPVPKKKKKFPVFLTAAGVVLTAVVIYLLLKKKKQYELTVSVGDGVGGTPNAGIHTYKKGETVNYSYTLMSGYTDLTVLLDNSPAAASGTIEMNRNHTLNATTTKLVSVHIESTPSAAQVYVDGLSAESSTPCDLLITEGSHELKLVKDYCGEATRTNTFEDNKSYTIDATLSGYTYEFFAHWGEQGNGDGQFDFPADIAVNNNDYVYVVDYGRHRVSVFDTSGLYKSNWGSEGGGKGEFNSPMSLAIDNSNNVYVCDSLNRRIQKFSSSGNFIIEWGAKGVGDGQFLWAAGIAADNANNIYVTDLNAHRVQKFSSTGQTITEWGGKGNNNGQLDGPTGIAVDTSNNVYVCEKNNHRVQKFTSNGDFIITWGEQGGSDGKFRQPRDISVGNSDNVYVLDTSNHRVQKFDSNGTFLTKWGIYGSGTGQFDDAHGIFADSNGYVYVSDSDNHRIQKFKQSTTQTDNDGTWVINTSPSNISGRKSIAPMSFSPDKFRKEKEHPKKKRRVEK
ncbi:MAG: PEGA domain-containing protein [Candidatus Aminicenantes bacterium]|nr:PEGA domain-containing protein [Candidatus Aminicenantes bacterium]